MLIALLVIIYVLIICVVGCAIYVYYKDEDEDSDIAGVVGGFFWPLTIVFLILCTFFTFLCSNICKVLEYLKNEGFHYCKEDIKPCCGQCKHMYYCNNHNEVSGCSLSKGTYRLSSDGLPCNQFKKHWLWRFRIRYKWDDK